MKKKKLISISALILLFIGCVVFYEHFFVQLPRHVSILQLISNPQKYHNKPVIVTGFLSTGFENCILFLHKEDAQFFIAENGIHIDPTSEMLQDYDEINSEYVTIAGVFNKKRFISASHHYLEQGYYEVSYGNTNTVRHHYLEEMSLDKKEPNQPSDVVR